MRFTTLVAAAAPMVALAQAATFMITVGLNATNTYTPPTVPANVGDVIEFRFVGDNHTVTQSTFANPCMKMTPPGADSGFMPVAAGAAPATFNYTVTSTNPTWFYCQQGTHCQQGMVFAVNPTTTETYAMFKTNAMSSMPNSMSAMSSHSMSATSMMPSASTTKASGALGLYGGSAAFVATMSGLVAGLFLH